MSMFEGQPIFAKRSILRMFVLEFQYTGIIISLVPVSSSAKIAIMLCV